MGQVLGRPAGGGWLVFAGGPAAALAASHLRSPATFTVQLDHLLSSVEKVNHIDPENGAHIPPYLATRLSRPGRNRGKLFIAATGRGPRIQFGGPVSEMGWSVARAAGAALDAGIQGWLERNR